MAAFIVALLILVVAGVALVKHARANKKRREAYRAVAEGMGWSYTERDPALIGPYLQLPLFSTGNAHPAENVLRGDFGSRPTAVFEFAYTSGSGKNRSTLRQTIVHMQGPTAELPEFELRPQVKFVDALIKAFGYQDIEIAERPEFTRRFVLRGPDEPAIRARFTERIIDAFEEIPGVCVQAFGSHLFLYRMGQVVMPDALPEWLTHANDLLLAFEAEHDGSGARPSHPPPLAPAGIDTGDS